MTNYLRFTRVHVLHNITDRDSEYVSRVIAARNNNINQPRSSPKQNFIEAELPTFSAPDTIDSLFGTSPQVHIYYVNDKSVITTIRST